MVNVEIDRIDPADGTDKEPHGNDGAGQQGDPTECAGLVSRHSPEHGRDRRHSFGLVLNAQNLFRRAV